MEQKDTVTFSETITALIIITVIIAVICFIRGIMIAVNVTTDTLCRTCTRDHACGQALHVLERGT